MPSPVEQMFSNAEPKKHWEVPNELPRSLMAAFVRSITYLLLGVLKRRMKRLLLIEGR
jgi:hypothetical protein